MVWFRRSEWISRTIWRLITTCGNTCCIWYIYLRRYFAVAGVLMQPQDLRWQFPFKVPKVLLCPILQDPTEYTGIEQFCSLNLEQRNFTRWLPVKKARALRSTSVKYDLYTLYTNIQKVRREVEESGNTNRAMIDALQQTLSEKLTQLRESVVENRYYSANPHGGRPYTPAPTWGRFTRSLFVGRSYPDYEDGTQLW